MNIDIDYLHYNYGILTHELYVQQPKFLFYRLFEIFWFSGLIFCFLPMLLRILGLFRWGEEQKLIERRLLSLIGIVGVFLFFINSGWGWTGGLFPSEHQRFPGGITGSAYTKYKISLRLYNLKSDSSLISEYDIWDLKKLPDDSPYKKYSPDMPLEEQKTLIKELDKWWKDNKNYTIWDKKSNKFIMDEEAKTAGIWTDEYRKTHPYVKGTLPIR
jgi:hypothetical protein